MNTLQLPAHRDPVARATLMIIALAVVASAVYPTIVARAAVAEATPPPIIIVATPTLDAAPVAETLVLDRPFAAVLDLEIDVYGAPEGNWIGRVEAGRAFTPIARRGGDWVRLDVDGSGLVWAPIGSVPGVALSELPDVVPQPAPAPASAVRDDRYVEYRPAVPEQQFVAAEAPPTAELLYPTAEQVRSIGNAANPTPTDGSTEQQIAERNQERCALASVDDDQGGSGICQP